ncbi:DoxX protein [Mucilaginibacter pineti]|uniref:DoxX protein n=1 Tax=Mucilaginibacter pineti TaxID=1391627 RepID=A0A1G7JN95_9SPHI|nr:DoxX family membrane protein [Mucilaginibacter pineti]SDF26325.1 DoxX protein [Mucilaginibacter pineti]
MKTPYGFGQLILRLALGIGFILPTLDRLGFMGPPGSPKVAWGDWSHFVNYTNVLVPFVSRGVAQMLAFLATAAEALFGVTLIIGFKVKWMALGSAIITLTFAVSMMFALGLLAPFSYPVFVFTGGALVLSGLGEYQWSFDELIAKNND